MTKALRCGAIVLAFAGTSALACGSGSGGATGSAGQTATAGANGAAGATAGSGGAGTSGTAGTSGVAGTTGAAGTSGAAGSNGTAGASGAAGSNGTAGTSGAAGATGAAGAGTAGAGGTAGASGTAGTTGTAGAAGFADPKTYTCNLLLGVSITYDWFTSGFETYVDNAKWEAMAPTTPGMSFVETWADSAGATWALPKVSACTRNAATPQRILFTAVNWTYTTSAQWVKSLEDFVATVKMKFPSVVEIDLLTMMRAPNNMMSAACTSTEDVVAPFIDDAIQTVVGKYPTLVRAAPKVFAPDCGVFTDGGPHLTTAGKPVIAKLYGDLYAQEQ